MNRNLLLTLGAIAAASALILFLLLWQGWLFAYREANVLPVSTMTLPEHNIQLSAPDNWVFLDIPNPYLNYPEAPVQAASKARDAFCIVVPERIADATDMTLDRFQTLAIETLLQQPEAKILLQDPATSDWSERTRLVYSTKQGVQTVQYLMQLDLAPPFAFRTIAWTAAENYAEYEPAFQALCTGLKPIQ